ncbi:MAG: PrsW family intramembrane metalloprotease [Treponemataceae bacterium]|nr:PrsW family intramembrane metalloprotease [Treponemataceae bacterium]
MESIATIGICFVPLIILTAVLLAVCKKLTVGSALISILSGFAAIIPIAVIQLLVLSLPVFSSTKIVSVFLTAILFNGLIEETLKMLMLMIIPGKKKDIFTFTICSMIAGFSIGTFETIVYMLMYGTGAIILRYATAVLIHTFCAGLSGLYVWSFKHKKQYIRPFVASVFIHGLYNFFAGFILPLKIFSYVTILYAVIRLKFSYDRLTNSESDDKIVANYDAG